MTNPQLTTCATHGLRFDRSSQDGCVVCRREPSPSARPRRRYYPWIGLAVGLVAVGVGTSVALGGDDPEVAPSAGDGDPVRAYLAAAHAELDAAPLQASREALEGMNDEAQSGTLDTRARRDRIRAVIATVEAQRDRVRALVPPEAARAHHRAALGYYAQLLALIELNVRMTQRHDRTQRVIGGRDRVRTHEDAQQYRARIEDNMRAVEADMEQGRIIEARAHALADEVDAEARRLDPTR